MYNIKYEDQVFVNRVQMLNDTITGHSTHLNSIDSVLTYFSSLSKAYLYKNCEDAALFTLTDVWNVDYTNLYFYMKALNGSYTIIIHYCFTSDKKVRVAYQKIKNTLGLIPWFIGQVCCSKNCHLYVGANFLFDKLNEQYAWSKYVEKGSQTFENWCELFKVKYTPKDEQSTKENAEATVLVDIDGNTQTLEDILNENKRLKKTLEHIWEEQEDWKKKKENFEKQCLQCQEHYYREEELRKALEEELKQVKDELASTKDAIATKNKIINKLLAEIDHTWRL